MFFRVLSQCQLQEKVPVRPKTLSTSFCLAGSCVFIESYDGNYQPAGSGRYKVRVKGLMAGAVVGSFSNALRHSLE